MCNLYSVRTSRGALARKFGLSDNRMATVEALPAIFPGHTAPIIKQGGVKLEASARQLIERGAGAPVERQKSASLARCRRRHLGPLDDNDVDPAASEEVRCRLRSRRLRKLRPA